MIKEHGDYPLGTEYNSKAPWNEPEDIKHTRFVSVTISYYTTVMAPKDADDESIENAIIKDVYDGNFPSVFNVDECFILNE